MMAGSKIYDALIAGSGPAGLSAALGLSRVRRTVAIFTKPNGPGFRNEGTPEMHNVLSRDGTAPPEFVAIGAEQVRKYGHTDFFETELVNFRETSIMLHENQEPVQGFEVEDTDGKVWKGRKLVLAMGCVDVFPDIQGYRENWPENM